MVKAHKDTIKVMRVRGESSWSMCESNPISKKDSLRFINSTNKLKYDYKSHYFERDFWDHIIASTDDFFIINVPTVDELIEILGHKNRTHSFYRMGIFNALLYIFKIKN